MQTGTSIQKNSIIFLKTLCDGFIEKVLLEGIFEDNVEQTTYPLYQRNQISCIKTTKQYANDPFDNSAIETGNGNALMNNMKREKKKKRWEGVITSTNMTHTTRNAWKTIIHISNAPTSSTPPCLVAHHLLIYGRGTMSTKPKQPVLPPTIEVEESMVYPFREDERGSGIAALKNRNRLGAG